MERKKIEYPAQEREPQLKALWSLAFGDSGEAIEQFFTTAYAPERCRCVLLDGQVAAALYWFDTRWDGQKLAYLYAVATHPDFRNRGLCRALMEDTHQLLMALGYDGALLTPAETPLRRMYAGMGYQDCCSVSELSSAAGTPVAVREIGREEYAILRRKLLPEGGVIQEGENLAYLETYAQLYAGEDFLLAAVQEGGKLHGLELLGNKDAAPGILAALGCREGSFRVPGKDIPFTMFRPLKAGARAPGYFGLAFD